MDYYDYNFNKFNKIDKLVISLILVFFIFYCLLTTFSFCETTLNFNTLNDVRLIHSTVNLNYEGYNTNYWSVFKGYKYIILNNSTSSIINFYGVKDFSDGQPVLVLATLNPSETATINLNDYDFNYIAFSYKSSIDVYNSLVTLSIDTNVTGNVLYNLAYHLSSINLWDTFNTLIPFVLIVVVFGFGLYLIRKCVKGISKGKSNL